MHLPLIFHLVMARLSLPPLLILASLAVFNIVCCTSQRRNLSEVRYHYTSCGATGRIGPTFAQCTQYYTEVGSPIFSHGVNFEFENGIYTGAQGFRVLRSGIFNITVSGERGGIGLCNIESGRGNVRKVQVEISTEFELLIMVGQRGVSVCDAEPDFFLCENPPIVFPNTTTCSEKWRDWLFNSSLSGLAPGEANNVYAGFGGAGGGGASLVRARNITSGEFDGFPKVIAAGGGGSAAILNYSIVEDLDEIEDTEFNMIEYISLLHGKTRDNDRDFSAIPGVRGSRDGSSSSVAGAGGGYTTLFRRIDVDGGFLSVEQNFALGGTDCAQHFESTISVPFSDTYGGFGGGGGGCGGGGGGGGYTGGPVLQDGNQVPGGGGYSYLGTSLFTSFDPVLISDGFDFINDNGYVDIVRVDCGCVHNCTVFEDTDQFECNCPVEASLAPDFSDCFYASEMMVSQGPLIEDHTGVPFSIVTFTNYSYIFSMKAILGASGVRRISKRQSSNSGDGGNEKCALLFIGENSDIVLASNAVSGSGTVDMLAAVNVNLGAQHSISNFTSFLNSSVLVTGAVLVGTANCTIQNMLLQMNASIQPVNAVAPPSSIDVEVIALVASVVLERPAPPALSAVAVSGIVVVCVIAAVIIIIVITALSICGGEKCKSRRIEARAIFSEHVNAPEDSLVRNTAYVKCGAQVQQDVGDDTQDHRYELLEYEKEAPVVSDVRRASFFKPVHGVNAPAHDFSEFNKQRNLISIKDWEYPRSKLIYMRELGEGQFGKVLLMKAEAIAGYKGQIPVAVKTLTSKDPEVIAKFTEEADLMRKFSHPNIVSLLGFSDQIAGEDSAPLMILEYMPFGDLQNFLVSHRPTVERRSLITNSHFYCFACDVGGKDIMGMAGCSNDTPGITLSNIQIAKGLEFLSKMKYIHRDVAARNCLVGANLQIKIADFGLARLMVNKDYYKLGGKAVLPVRWMAPESLLFGVFTSAADVWSYGVLLWEIVTYGEMPFEDMELNAIVKAATSKHLRHTRPLNCPDDLYDIICQCHTHEAVERPSFTEILLALNGKEEELSAHSQASQHEGSVVI